MLFWDGKPCILSTISYYLANNFITYQLYVQWQNWIPKSFESENLNNSRIKFTFISSWRIQCDQISNPIQLPYFITWNQQQINFINCLNVPLEIGTGSFHISNLLCRVIYLNTNRICYHLNFHLSAIEEITLSSNNIISRCSASCSSIFV